MKKTRGTAKNIAERMSGRALRLHQTFAGAIWKKLAHALSSIEPPSEFRDKFAGKGHFATAPGKTNSPS